MIIVTADTNIYISGLQFGGIPLTFLEYARAGAFSLAVSAPLLAEIAGILMTKFAWSPDQVDAALTELARCSVTVEPNDVLNVIKDDPDDDRILECAVAAQARFIVSGDIHLLRLGAFRDIRIMKVAEFMALLPTL